MKRGTFVMYPGHVVLMNFMTKFQLYMIDSGYTLVRFLPIDYKDVLGATAKANQCGNCDCWQVRKAHEEEELEDFVPQTIIHRSDEGRGNIFSFDAIYCCENIKTNDMSGILYHTMVRQP